MSNLKKIVFIIAIFPATVIGILAIPGQSTSTSFVYVAGELPHRQEVWVHSLEWCESRAVNSAVNPKDKDGTASYYNWQFKPDTFKLFGEKYGVIAKNLPMSNIMELLKDYNLQHQVVNAMVRDGANINWHQQFPDCVAKLGLPPKE